MTLNDLPRDILFYLATPYTNYTTGHWSAYKEAARIAGLLVGAGLNIYSPIAHSHPLAIYGGLDPLDHALWMRVDAPFVALCDGLLVAKMEEWEASKGLSIEVAKFATANKPIFFLDPQTLALATPIEQAAEMTA